MAFGHTSAPIAEAFRLNEATMNLGFLDGGTAAHEFDEWSLANTFFRFAITIAPAEWANTRSKSLRGNRTEH
jgi:hypothetical protein